MQILIAPVCTMNALDDFNADGPGPLWQDVGVLAGQPRDVGSPSYAYGDLRPLKASDPLSPFRLRPLHSKARSPDLCRLQPVIWLPTIPLAS